MRLVEDDQRDSTRGGGLVLECVSRGLCGDDEALCGVAGRHVSMVRLRAMTRCAE